MKRHLYFDKFGVETFSTKTKLNLDLYIFLVKVGSRMHSNGEAKEFIHMTHGHELSGGGMHVGGVMQGREE